MVITRAAPLETEIISGEIAKAPVLINEPATKCAPKIPINIPSKHPKIPIINASARN